VCWFESSRAYKAKIKTVDNHCVISGFIILKQTDMIQFTCVPFKELTIQQLYEILALRQQVFIIEQNCLYLDADGKDLDGWHLMGRNTEGVLVAYTRLLPKDISYPNYASIGRVVNSDKVRGQGVGKLLMEQSIAKMAELFPNQPVKIGAQTYLLKFYTSLGFVSTGEEYIEDGIPHTSMILHQ
jgi:ElaA protein